MVVAGFSPALSTWRFLGFFEGFLRKHAAKDPEHDENSKKHALCHVERAGLKPATTFHTITRHFAATAASRFPAAPGGVRPRSSRTTPDTGQDVPRSVAGRGAASCARRLA